MAKLTLDNPFLDGGDLRATCVLPLSSGGGICVSTACAAACFTACSSVGWCAPRGCMVARRAIAAVLGFGRPLLLLTLGAAFANDLTCHELGPFALDSSN